MRNIPVIAIEKAIPVFSMYCRERRFGIIEIASRRLISARYFVRASSVIHQSMRKIYAFIKEVYRKKRKFLEKFSYDNMVFLWCSCNDFKI